MKPGSVVVDLAAAAGGNCELTKPGETITHNGVHIVGHTDFTSRLSTTCSQLYGTNLWHLLKEMGGGENFTIDMENDAVRPAIVANEGEVTWAAKGRRPESATGCEAKGGSQAARCRRSRTAGGSGSGSQWKATLFRIFNYGVACSDGCLGLSAIPEWQ